MDVKMLDMLTLLSLLCRFQVDRTHLLTSIYAAQFGEEEDEGSRAPRIIDKEAHNKRQSLEFFGIVNQKGGVAERMEVGFGSLPQKPASSLLTRHTHNHQQPLKSQKNPTFALRIFAERKFGISALLPKIICNCYSYEVVQLFVAGQYKKPNCDFELT